MVGIAPSSLSGTQRGKDSSRNRILEADRFSKTAFSNLTPIEPVEPEVAEKIAAKIRLAVGLDKFRRLKTSFGDLVAAYNACWNSLDECKTDWIRFLSSVPLIDTAVEGDDRLDTILQMSKEAKEGWKQLLLKGLVWPAESTFSGLSASLSVLPLVDAQEKLSDDLSSKIDLIARQMVSHLTLLVERRVCGLIEWYGPNSCKYQFYVRQIMSYELEHLKKIWVPIPKNFGEGVEKIQRTGKHDRSIVWHIHEIVNAIEVHPGNTSMRIPKDRQPIIESVPCWLNGMVRIVEGALIREIKIVEDCESQTWTDVKERPLSMHLDPAIVLGSYVLSGWKDSDEKAPVIPNPKENVSFSGVKSLGSVLRFFGIKR